MSARTIRIFIDTNVWFSAFYSSKNCQILINAHREEKVCAVISELVLKELVRNVKNKIPDHFGDLRELFTNAPPEIVPDPVDIPKKLIKLVSLKDLPIFVSCLQNKVKYFITGNIKDFKVKQLKTLTGIKILTPKEVVLLLGL